MLQILLFMVAFFQAQSLCANPLTIEITEGAEGAIPVAIVPFGGMGSGSAAAEDMAAIVDADLKRSGRFKTLPRTDMLSRPSDASQVDFRDWQMVGVDYLAVGEVRPNGVDGFLVRFQLLDANRRSQLVGYDSVPTSAAAMRSTAHWIADVIYEKLLGEPGAFNTRIAYVTTVSHAGGRRVNELRIADADGFNSQTIASSPEPIMSPAWAPDGGRLAYVAFESGQPGVYVQEVFTHRVERVAAHPGINGAPAWSPDGRKLALTLSKDGNPDVFVLDLGSRQLRPVTRHFAIDTEPAWMPDGRSLMLTSDRGGSPQIYSVSLGGENPRRVTFESSYNASPAVSPNGKMMAFVTREDGNYRIALKELDTGLTRTLSTGRADESPTFAPNGSMVLYASKAGGRGVLEAVSVDGRVRQRLALSEGDVREPAWSPAPK